MSNPIIFKSYIPTTKIVENTYQYQDINKDTNLRRNVTLFFHKKILKWINKDTDFEKLKPKLEFYESKRGKKHIYKLLRNFVKITETNWYNLEDIYLTVKKYLLKNL